MEIVNKSSGQVSKESVVESNELITMRIMNLPYDMNGIDVSKIFGVETEKVSVVKLRNNILVKVIIPTNKEQELLKLDQTFLNKRKIRVFRIKKCRLGHECKRIICRFGHEEKVHVVEKVNEISVPQS